MREGEFSVKYNVSASPHIRSKITTNSIMLMVILALMPTTIFGVFKFGFNALLLIVITTATCVATEYIYQKMLKQTITIQDYSAALTGLLLALNLPPQAPWWIGVIGGVFAILVVKQLFGGLGQNIMNPALAARCFLLISFTGIMTDFSVADTISGATPLAEFKASGAISEYSVMDLIIGNIPGTIGEVSAIAILIGAAFLFKLKIIDYRIPVTYIGSFLIFIILFGGNGLDPTFIAVQLFGGGLMFGALFMATDYVTSPITKQGQLVYGVCLGILTGVFRIYGASAEGVSYAIIFCNLLVPLIEKVTLPKPFGKGGKTR
ncbi:NADH:ubiquinone oxidoreductase [Candidatus Epulonipiscium fishelsonii]|uniref:NADH:ubiquinone oxidoreductase n=1 Tax=Candidatus Epulonipiscium fishelsonii TaxID=77094 RepID=A0ACC8XFP5_9FIRM|nr:NADH:ubiquinone oxidoreductase [Epulopiscium sp. SCG-B11WGA-EpuloA1]ONI43861.1 NADH:ubiquinone oxidoreductase [Epulopiscium sp. SCG-B05WGA-EpuloA1]